MSASPGQAAHGPRRQGPWRWPGAPLLSRAPQVTLLCSQVHQAGIRVPCRAPCNLGLGPPRGCLTPGVWPEPGNCVSHKPLGRPRLPAGGHTSRTTGLGKSEQNKVACGCEALNPLILLQDGRKRLRELSMSLQIKFLNFILGFAQQRLVWLAKILRGRLSSWQGHVKVTRERRERGSSVPLPEHPCTHARGVRQPGLCSAVRGSGPRRLWVYARCRPCTCERPEGFLQPGQARGRSGRGPQGVRLGFYAWEGAETGRGPTGWSSVVGGTLHTLGSAYWLVA